MSLLSYMLHDQCNSVKFGPIFPQYEGKKCNAVNQSEDSHNYVISWTRPVQTRGGKRSGQIEKKTGLAVTTKSCLNQMPKNNYRVQGTSSLDSLDFFPDYSSDNSLNPFFSLHMDSCSYSSIDSSSYYCLRSSLEYSLDSSVDSSLHSPSESSSLSGSPSDYPSDPPRTPPQRPFRTLSQTNP